MTSQTSSTILSLMLAVLDTPVAVEWYKQALGARELVEGKVKGVPGPLVFERLRKRLGG
jgi:hypothetical protein